MKTDNIYSGMRVYSFLKCRLFSTSFGFEVMLEKSRVSPSEFSGDSPVMRDVDAFSDCTSPVTWGPRDLVSKKGA